MAAGLGFKTFTTGEVLTAADTNGYLMQGVLVFASAAARDAAITSPQEGQCCYLKDTDAVLTYSGAAWVGFDDSNAIQNAIVDAKGDLITATAADTPSRLAVGTNAQVLTADSTTATGLKWATPAAAASGMTFISRTAFSSVSSQTFDSVFSSTYETYLIVAENIYSSTGTNDIQFQWRYSGTTQAASYYGTSAEFLSTTTFTQSTNTAEFTITRQIGYTSQPGSFSAWITNAGQTSENPTIYGSGMEGSTPGAVYTFGCFQLTARTYTGFLLKPNTGTITGEVTVYGLAKS
jgi:hypothetical protein